MALPVEVDLPAADRKVLESWTRESTMPDRLVKRARIVLLAGDGAGTSEIMSRTGASKPTVIQWKRRYIEGGLAGLDDRPRVGRPKEVDEVAIVLATLERPQQLGMTHWSSRFLARELGISNVAAANVWRKWGLQPWRTETFAFPTDPELEANVCDVLAVYLNPPDKAVVVRVDEKSHIESPFSPVLPARPLRTARDDLPYSTATVFAALEEVTAPTPDACDDRHHRRRELLSFLKLVERSHPRVQLHVVYDGCGTQEDQHVMVWLQEHPRMTLHLAPARESWLTMAEVFFGIVDRHATSPRTEGFIKAISTFNGRGPPFVWMSG